MARVKQDLRESLAAAGLLARIAKDRIYMTFADAVEAFKNRQSLARHYAMSISSPVTSPDLPNAFTSRVLRFGCRAHSHPHSVPR